MSTKKETIISKIFNVSRDIINEDIKIFNSVIQNKTKETPKIIDQISSHESLLFDYTKTPRWSPQNIFPYIEAKTKP